MHWPALKSDLEIFAIKILAEWVLDLAVHCIDRSSGTWYLFSSMKVTCAVVRYYKTFYVCTSIVISAINF